MTKLSRLDRHTDTAVAGAGPQAASSEAGEASVFISLTSSFVVVVFEVGVLLDSPDWPQTQSFACLRLRSTGIKGGCL